MFSYCICFVPSHEIQHSTFRRKNAGYFSEGFCEPRAHGPTEAHPVCALAILHSALFRVRLQGLDSQSCLSHHTVPLTLLLGSPRQGTKTGLSLFLALPVPPNQCRGTWVGQHVTAWLLLQKYTYTANKSKSSTQ